jgi:hypothetical protein
MGFFNKELEGDGAYIENLYFESNVLGEIIQKGKNYTL